MLVGGAVGAVAGGIWAIRQRGGAQDISHLHQWYVSHRSTGFSPPILIAIAMFAMLSLYWEAAAKDAPESKTQESRRSRAIHVTLVTVAQVLLLLPVPFWQERLVPRSAILTVTGLVIEFAFLLFAVWARRQLGRNWSGAIAIKVDQKLVRSGPYRWVRHPIYSAFSGTYLGLLLISGELHALIGMILVCVAYWRKIRLEEQFLSRVFGADYEDYKNSTSAVIPGIV
ncbi:MAG TPA: isoprenylcysteine carboxylmethyltransferase family protein [Candidatus Solibacter sp.]|nr:isoprenylcysteine carboxylmethyltransferase family protein [Candidatus Solibacter sp.]